MNEAALLSAPATDVSQLLQESARQRQHRARAAHLLSAIPSRSDVEWDDLMAIPAWAVRDDDEALGIETLSVGAWAHLDQIRRCIDGRLLAHLGGLLGQAELDRIMASERLRDDDGLAMASLGEPLGGLGAAALRQRLMFVGQWIMLQSVGRQRLRKVLAQALWPHIPHLQKDRAPEEMPHDLATAIMRARAVPSVPGAMP